MSRSVEGAQARLQHDVVLLHALGVDVHVLILPGDHALQQRIRRARVLFCLFLDGWGRGLLMESGYKKCS
jgi:hypothetical protein